MLTPVEHLLYARHMCVLVTQLCPILCDPMYCNLPGSSVHGILQTRILEWVAISFSRREDCLLVSRLLYVRRQND